jgi:hypothetical protein
MVRVENVAALTATSTGAFFVEAHRPSLSLLTGRLHHEKNLTPRKK